MKKIALLFLSLCSFGIICAKPQSNSFFYFFSPEQETTFSDENVELSYGLYTHYKFNIQGFDLDPFPVLKMEITNKTDKTLYIDLGKSYIIYNGNMQRMSQHIISVPALSKVTTEDIEIITEASVQYLSDFFYFREVGQPQRTWILSRQLSDVMPAQNKDFTEANSPIRLGYMIAYSQNENFAQSNSIKTTYYLNRIVGSRVSTFPGTEHKEFDIVSKAYPKWRDDINYNKIELIRVWAYAF